MALRDAYQLPLAAPGALRAGVDFLNRLPEIERSVSAVARRIGDVLDDVLERVRPVEMELEALKEEAKGLRSELAGARGDLATLDQRIEALSGLTARLEGSLEHLLDRVPGLSADQAMERGAEIARSEEEARDGVR